MSATLDDFVVSRDVPPEWEATLASVSPRSEQSPWLKLAWMSGIYYEPVSRWVLYEMVPNLAIVDPFRLAALRGAAPRELGEWKADDGVPGKKRWVSHSLVSQMQWDLFRESGCAPFLFWIIQGANGGHRWRLPAVEKHFVTTLYGPGADVPNPGERPYAAFDGRVIEQIERHDKLRRWDAVRRQGYGSRSMNKTAAGLWVARETWDMEKAYGATMLKYLTDQIEDGVSNLSDQEVARLMDKRVPGDPYYNAGREALEQRLVEDTSHALPPE